MTKREIFLRVQQASSDEERVRLLDEACGGNAELRAEIESLLAYDRDDDFLEQPPVASPPDPIIGSSIGPYKILQEIGEGGMGVVYMAEQRRPIERRVALKIIKLGMDTRQVIARFEAERQALAMMDHPGIARVLDGGSTESQISNSQSQIPGGRPYFVMELVRGLTLTEYCDKNTIATPERLKLFAQVCRAVHHAHQKGVIHRDIKPSNILVTLIDGKPVPKIIDFGIAKATNFLLTEKTLFTEFKNFVGTPLYMSPEQMEMSGQDVDTRSDIYSLGVLLYELLTGSTPIERNSVKKAAYAEIQRMVMEVEPPKPSTRLSTLGEERLGTVSKSRACEPSKLRKLIRGELDWIVMKALEKDRSRRYGSAAGFAEEIERYLAHEPVRAVRPSLIYGMRKFARRNRVLLAASGLVIATLVLGTVVSVTQAVRATKASVNAQVEADRARVAAGDALRQRERAEASELRAKRHVYISDMATAQREFYELNTMRAIELLNQHIPGPDEPDFRDFEWRWLWNQCHQEVFQLRGHTKMLRDMNFSRDGRLLATGAIDGTVRLWNIETRREIWRYQGGEHCNRADFSPDGRWLVTSFYLSVNKKGDTVVWDIKDPASPREVFRHHQGGDFAPDGETLWSGGRQYDLSGGLIREIHSTWATGQDFSKDAKTSAWLDWDGNGYVADLPSGKLTVLPKHEGYYDIPVKGIAISPVDEDVIVTGSALGARIWNREGALIRVLAGTEGTPLSMIRFSKDGDLLAVRKFMGAIVVFDTETWTQVAAARTPQPGNTLAFSPQDNTLLVAGGEDGVIRGWRVTPNRPVDRVLDHSQEVLCLEFSPDGAALAAGLYDGSARFWDVATEEEILTTPPRREIFATLTLENMRDFVAFSPDGSFAAVIGPETTVSVWDLREGAEIRTEPLTDPDRYRSIVFSGDGSRLYVGTRRSIDVFDWNPEERRLAKVSEHPIPANLHLAISPNGRWLAAASDGIALLSLKEDRPVRTLAETEWSVPHLAFSPDGFQLAGYSGGSEGVGVFIWDVASGQIAGLLPNAHPSLYVSWMDDGSRLAVSGLDRTTSLWDVESRQVVATYPGSTCVFSPDGKILAVGAGNKFTASKEAVGRVTLYHAPPLSEIDARRTASDAIP